jgi:hypothetical protein
MGTSEQHGPPANAPVEPEPPTPDDFAGTYTFYHDGWRCWLRLSRPEAGRLLRGRLFDYKLDGKQHDVEAEVSADASHRVRIRVLDYNWMPDGQFFDGFLFRRSKNAIAGTTVWAGDQLSYGFFARKTTALTLSRFGEMSTKRPDQEAERVVREECAGLYSVWEDGEHGVMRLVPGPQGLLQGTYRPGSSGATLAVEGLTDEAVPHHVELVARGGGSERAFHGYLFSRPKNAVAGWMEVGGRAQGFYMTKLAPLPQEAAAGRSTASA